MIRIINQLKQKIRNKDFITNLILTILVFSFSLIPFLWFKNNQVLLGYDNVYPLNAIDFLRDRLFSWSSVQGFGFDQSGQQGSLIIHFIDSIPQFFGASIQLSQKIVFSFWFFLLLASPYLLIVKLEKANIVRSKYLRYFFPILYTFNFYILQAWWVAERTKFSLVVATPLILSVILPMITSSLCFKKVLKNALICSVILSIFNGGGWVGLPLYGGLLITLAAVYVFFSAIYLLKRKRRDFLFFNIFFALFGLSFVFINAYTLLPFILTTLRSYTVQMSAAGGTTSLVDWARYLSTYSSFINLFRLQGIPDMYNSIRTHPYAAFYLNNSLMILTSFIFPLLILFALLNKRKGNKKIISLFLFLLIVSMFFTSGVNGITGIFFKLLMEKIPGFAVFRSPIYKFGYAYWLSVSFLIGLSISNILESILNRIKGRTFAFILGVSFPIIIITSIVFYYFPYLTGDIFRISADEVSSRVEIPDYVFKFSDWWKKTQGNNKILLLPRLNENWMFEQYRWGYLSLFPILANFGNTGLVENTDSLSEQENTLLLKLYSSINSEDYEIMDRVSSMLGISYFLVRKDFDYVISDQETDSPFLIERSIMNNKNLHFDRSFGEWDVYGYKNLKPLILAKNSAISSNGAEDYSFLPVKDLLTINSFGFSRLVNTISNSVIVPICVSCGAERENIEVNIPKPQILMDSRLYQLVKFKNQLTGSANETYDQKVLGLIGDTLKLVGQFDALVTENKEEYYIELAKTDYVALLGQINELLKGIMTMSTNPYPTIVKTEKYLDEEYNFLSNLLLRPDESYVQVNTEKMLYELAKINDNLRSIYSEKDFNKKKNYKYNITQSGDYNFRIAVNSLGSINENDLAKISIKLDGQNATISGNLNEKFIDFDKIYLSSGNHSLELDLPLQNNLLSDPIQQRISGNNCFSSFAQDVSSKKAYDLSFSSKNNFDPIFFSFTDMNKEDVFKPNNLTYIPLLGEVMTKNRIVVSPSGQQINTHKNTLRVTFCASSLTEQLYRKNIADLNLVLLSEPKIFIFNQMNNVSNTIPKVEFKEINKTHYQVFVKEAEGPFYLIFNQRYSPGWKSTIGEHLLGNNINNVWFINEKGNFTLDIYYKPQRYFYFGSIISISFLILILIFFYLSKKYESKQK